MPDGSAPEPVPGSFLAGLNATVRQTFLGLGAARGYAANDVLFHQGDPSRYVVILQSGWVKVTAVSRNGWSTLLAIRGVGDILGERSAVDGYPRSATVRALTQVRATVIGTGLFRQSITEDGRVAMALMRHMVRSLRVSDDKRAEYGASSGQERLIGLLVELIDRHGRSTGEGIAIELPLTQQELASAVGVSREVVARTLRLLRERDILVTRRQRIVVRNWDLLKALPHSV